MSWEEALRDAEKWLANAGVPADKIKGQYFDLHEKGDTIPKGHGEWLYIAVVFGNEWKDGIEHAGFATWPRHSGMGTKRTGLLY